MSIAAEVKSKLVDVLTGPVPFLSSGNADADALKRDGYISVGSVFTASESERLRTAIDERIRAGRADLNAKVSYHVIEDPLTLAPCVVNLVSERVVDIARGYFSRTPFLADADCRRVLPVSFEDVNKNGLSSSNWHKDTRGRQIKIMVYLTDVGAEDSTFSFVPGTHGSRTVGFEASRYDDAEVARLGQPVDWRGSAGDAMMFDTNIVHRLTRRAGAKVRDTITLYFTPGQHLHKIAFDYGAAGARERQLRELVEGAPVFSKRI